MKGLYHRPEWVPFTITSEDSLVFGDSSTGSLKCTLCGKAILGSPIMDSEFAFDCIACVEAYKRLLGAYGPSLSEIGGLPSHVLNMNFFFVDIVGLSNPVQSVKGQIEKIEVLNRLIGSCEAFARTKEPKIVLPTGDGMAIGFYTNPESPLKLSVELHRKVNEYNNGIGQNNANVDWNNEDKSNITSFVRNNNGASMPASPSSSGSMMPADRKRGVGIRIGLSSGPIFVVNDIMGNQNIWRPGIIFARRVMDIGDNMHILLSENMAETLISLRDEYKGIIR
jgi:hypothetical protein